MEKIRFIDYVCNRIANGDFISASTSCNWLIQGVVYRGERASERQANGFDKDDFRIEIEPRLIAPTRFFLGRRIGVYSFQRLTLTKEDKAKLLKAWQTASAIQEERNRQSQIEHDKEIEALHWWP